MMELRDQILCNSRRKSLNNLRVSKRPVFIAPIICEQINWKRSKKVLSWQIRQTKAGNKILKLNASNGFPKVLSNFLKYRSELGKSDELLSFNQKPNNSATTYPCIISNTENFITPQASDGLRSNLKLTSLCKRYIKHPNGNLAELIAYKIIFPSSADKIDLPQNKAELLANSLMTNFPTPMASDSKGASPGRIKGVLSNSVRKYQLREAVYKSLDEIERKLNPEWVEWLMGYPLNWTAEIFLIKQN